MSIAMHGSYFGYNFGDTLLCRIFCDYLRRVCPDEEIVLPLANARNRRYIGADKRGVWASLRARALLFVGGGYFSESPSGGRWWSYRAYLRHLALAEAARAMRKPYAIFGLGAGPISRPWLRKRIRRVVQDAHIVIVRDEESRSFLEQIGVTREIQVWTDAVVSTMEERSMQIVPSGKSRLLLHCNAQPSRREVSVMEAAVRWARNAPNVGLVLASDGKPRRKAITWPQELISKAKDMDIEYIEYDGNPDSMLYLIDTADAVVTTKLHVGIVSCTKKKYVIAIPNHPKTRRFYSQAGLSEQCMPLSHFEADWLEAQLNSWSQGLDLNFDRLTGLSSKYNYESAIREFMESI